MVQLEWGRLGREPRVKKEEARGFLDNNIIVILSMYNVPVTRIICERGSDQPVLVPA